MRIAPGREPFVLYFDDPASQVGVRFVPPAALMTEHLKVDSLLVHELQTRRTQNQRTIAADEPCEVRILDDVQFLRCGEMTVNVNNLDASLHNRHITAFRWNDLKRYCRAYETFQKISAMWHVVLLVW